MKIYKFDVGLINDYILDDDPEFALMRLEFLSDGFNAHGIPITKEILEKDAKTVLGKPIVAKYNKYTNDVMGHEEDEIIVGYVPHNSELKFKHTNNGMFATVDGLISKLYSNEVYKLYQTHNERAVSVEFTVDWKDNTPESKEITGFNITGVTLLGLDYSPSCKLANSKIVRFSEEEISNYYKDKVLNKMSTLNQDRISKFVQKTYKVDTTKLDDTEWGDVDKTRLRNIIMEASNRDTLVKKVYALVEQGWEEAPSEKLKYPLMNLVGDTFYYNRYALSSALAYARQQDEKQVIVKIEELYEKFNLEGGKGSKMKSKKLEIEGREAWAEVIEKVQAHEGKDAYVDSIDDDYIIYTINDVRYRVEADIEVGDDDKTIKAEIKWDTKKEDADQKMSDNKDDKKVDDKDDKDSKPEDKIKKEKMADDDIDSEAMAEEIDKLKNIIMEYEEELADLRKFKNDTQTMQKEADVNQVMAEIKEFIEEEEFEKIKEKGMNCQFENLDAWKNEARAKAFECSKTHKNRTDGLWNMGIAKTKSVSKGLWD